MPQILMNVISETLQITERFRGVVSAHQCFADQKAVGNRRHANVADRWNCAIHFR